MGGGGDFGYFCAGVRGGKEGEEWRDFEVERGGGGSEERREWAPFASALDTLVSLTR